MAIRQRGAERSRTHLQTPMVLAAGALFLLEGRAGMHEQQDRRGIVLSCIFFACRAVIVSVRTFPAIAEALLHSDHKKNAKQAKYINVQESIASLDKAGNLLTSNAHDKRLISANLLGSLCQLCSPSVLLIISSKSSCLTPAIPPGCLSSMILRLACYLRRLSHLLCRHAQVNAETHLSH